MNNPKSEIQNPKWKTRPGFSFAEVMFAVIILGIGFIMIAAIFPVAIQQTRLTVDESTAAAVARQAAAALEQLAVGSETAASGQPLFPKSTGGPPANIMSIRNGAVQPPGSPAPPQELWERVSGNLILASDPRFAWTMIYSRGDNQFVQAYIFVLQQRNRTVFERSDLQSGLFVNLEARLIQVRVEGATAAGRPATIRLLSNAQFGAEGAFIVVASGTHVGHVYRLGTSRENDTYNPDPGYPVEDDLTLASTPAWIVGRGLEAGTPTGPAMDVSIYTTFFSVN